MTMNPIEPDLYGRIVEESERELAAHPPDRRHRVWVDQIMKGIGAVAVVVVVVLPVITLRVVADLGDDTEAIKTNQVQTQQNSDVQGCKTLYRAPLDDAVQDLQILTSLGLQYAVEGRNDELTTVIAALPDARKAIHDAADRYVEEVNQSVSDPDTFVSECKEQEG